MNHQVSRDVTDSYLSTPALFDQLREAQRTVTELIVRSAGQDPDRKLTRLPRDELMGRAFAQNHPREMGGQVSPPKSAKSTRVNGRGGSALRN